MKTAAVSFLALVLSLHSCSAFLVGRPSRPVLGFRIAQTTEPEEPAAAEPATSQETTEVAQDPSSTMDNPIEESEEKKKEKDEMIALRAEIAELETTLKMSRIKLASTTDRADDFSKAGYARKVAELEDMRRVSQMRQRSDKSASIASVLTEFLPMRDRLEELKQQFSDDDFGKQYNAIPSAMATAFDQLGVTEYTMAVGDPINDSRCVVIDQEYSEQVPKGSVLRPIRMGLELQGNVIRAAQCIASLGSQVAEPQQQDEDTSDATSEAESPSAEETA